MNTCGRPLGAQLLTDGEPPLGLVGPQFDRDLAADAVGAPDHADHHLDRFAVGHCYCLTERTPRPAHGVGALLGG